MRCDYFGLLAGIEFYTTGVWTAPVDCPNPSVRYVEVAQETADLPVRHLDHVCAEHNTLVRQLPGFVSSEPLVGVR